MGKRSCKCDSCKIAGELRSVNRLLLEILSCLHGTEDKPGELPKGKDPERGREADKSLGDFVRRGMEAGSSPFEVEQPGDRLEGCFDPLCEFVRDHPGPCSGAMRLSLKAKGGSQRNAL